MPATRSFIANFNGGELSPLLDARVDAAVYRNGCRVLENFVVRPYGGAFKRPGTEYCGAVKTAGSATRLIPFKRSTSTNYMLEFGANYVRVWTGGTSPAQVTVSSVTAWLTATAYVVGDVRAESGTNYWCREAHTSGTFSTDLAAGKWHAMTGSIFEMYSPYGASDLFQLQFSQVNDLMFLAHPSYPPRRLTHTSSTSWAFESVPWDFPPMGDINDTTSTITIQPNVSAWVTSTAYTVGQVRLQSGVLYMCATAHTSGTFATDLAAARWKAVRSRGPWERDEAYVTADMVDAAGVRYVCILANTAADSTRPPTGGSYATNWLAVGDSGLRLFASSSIFTAADVGSSFRIDIGAVKRTLFLNGTHAAAVDYTTEPIFIAGDLLVRTNYTATNVAQGELYLERSNDRITYDSVRHWKFQGLSDSNIAATYEGPSTGAYYRMRWTTTTSSAQTTGMFIEAVDGMVTGLFTISSYVSATEVVCSFDLPDVTFAPCEILTRPAVNWYRPAFTTTANPRSVAFHDSRLWFGGVSGDAARVWGSRLDDYYNYKTDAEDDSGMDLTLAATEANQIEWITSYSRSLVVGTTGDEWTIDAGENDSALTPTSVRARRRTRRGSDDLSPQLVSDALLWIGRAGRRVHEFSYDFTADRYQAPDMTQLAEHVTAGGIVQTSFTADPDSILWAVTANGVLLGFSYDRAQQITAWHRHITSGGYFESVASMYGTNGQDEVWFVVRRTINGSTVRYIERFYPTAQAYNFDTATDLFYVDCGKKVTPSGTAVTGLSHLAAASVAVWADGDTIESKTVTAGGGVTLSASATTAVIGIPITSQVQPMKLEALLDDGTGQGRHWRPNRVVLCLHKSYGGEFAYASGQTTQAIDYTSDYQREQATAAATALQTTRIKEHVQADWSDSVDFIVSHASPTPFNLLGYVLITEVEGK